MRGIVWEHVRRVRLVRDTDPAVQDHLRRLAYHQTRTLETKFHERAAERARLSAVFGVPFERLLTQEAMLEVYIERLYQAPPPPVRPPPTCLDCLDCARDRFAPGAYVCWSGWTGGRPTRLRTLDICRAFRDKRPGLQTPSRWDIQQELQGFLAAHGAQYHGGRWKAHKNDLAREAGTWGFHTGQQWEAAVRTWLGDTYGADFFLPHRWLVIETTSGALQLRQIDGIERVDATHAFVYEIKHQTSGYAQLALEYIPLLQRAYPGRLFTPVEINACDPYHALSPRARPPVRRLLSLAERQMDGQYQLLVRPQLAEDEVCEAGALVVHLQQLVCCECQGLLWSQEAEAQAYLLLTQDVGIPQTPRDVCESVEWLHEQHGTCQRCYQFTFPHVRDHRRQMINETL